MIKKYIRNGRDPRGVVTASKGENGKHLFGYSLCSPNDRFSKQKGTMIAERRQAPYSELRHNLPDVLERRNAVLSALIELQTRAEKYFK